MDVFTSVPFKGNPVAVIMDGDSLEKNQMQAIANWTNLSETTFICKPTHDNADYRLRIFTPKRELPFAGHPTIGSAWAYLQSGAKAKTKGRLVQECGKGLITIKVEDQVLFFALPEPVFQTPSDAVKLSMASALGISTDEMMLASVVDVGAVWLTIQLESVEKVLQLEPDMTMLAKTGKDLFVGVTVFGLHEKNSEAAVEVRSFAPAFGIPEDPVCGSGNGCVAALIQQHKILEASSYMASQGQALGRKGRVMVEFDRDNTIWLGGSSVTCINGFVTIY